MASNDKGGVGMKTSCMLSSIQGDVLRSNECPLEAAAAVKAAAGRSLDDDGTFGKFRALGLKMGRRFVVGNVVP